MSRFSEHKVIGYNKAVILKAGFKPGSETKINGMTTPVWVVAIEDDYLCVAFDSAKGKYPVRFYYDMPSSKNYDLNPQGNYLDLLGGVTVEEITRLGQAWEGEVHFCISDET